jgi:hypothetical protein
LNVKARIIRKLYSDLPRHNVSANKSWYQVYLEYLKDMGLNPLYRADLSKELNIHTAAVEEHHKEILEKAKK